jgi:hypothetical protein
MKLPKNLNVDHSTVSRDIKYLTAQSQNYLNDLAKETLPFMYQTSIEGIRSVLKESWNLYNSSSTDNSQKLAALKLAKECNEAICKLTDEDEDGDHLDIIAYITRVQENSVKIWDEMDHDITKLSPELQEELANYIRILLLAKKEFHGHGCRT